LIPSLVVKILRAFALVRPFPFLASAKASVYFSVNFEVFGLMILTFSQCIFSPCFFARAFIFRGSPIRIGFANPWLIIVSVASKILGSSPSGKTIFLGFAFAEARTLRRKLCIG